MIIDELIAILGYDIKGQGNLDKFNRGMEQAAQLAQRAAAVVVAAGTVLAGAMTAIGKSVIDTSATFEGFQTSLETIEGSQAKAKQSMDWITKFAAKTPYDLEGVTKAFIKLKTYGIDPTDGTLTTLGDTASAMNKPLDQAVEAFADATNFQFERLREFGLTASQEGEKVTFQWTKNGKTLTKVVKKNGADIQNFIKQHFGSTFNGAMIRQSKTWNGMMANLGDSWELFKKKIGDAGFFQHVKSRLGSMLDYIGKLDEDGTLGRWATNISKALIAGFDLAEKAVLGLVGAIQKVSEFFSGDGTLFENIKAKLENIDWSAAGKTIGNGLVEGVKADAVAIFEIMRDIDWVAVAKAWIAALKAQVQFIKGVFDGIGESIGESILSGLKSVGDDINAWFQSILPEWAADFFAFRAKEAGALSDKATEAGNRRRQMEGLTKPYNPNLKLPEVFRNYQGNMARMGGMSGVGNTTLNAPTSVTINMPVQQITNAANAAANAVREKVSSALSNVSSHPTRTTPSPTF